MTDLGSIAPHLLALCGAVISDKSVSKSAAKTAFWEVTLSYCHFSLLSCLVGVLSQRRKVVE